MANRITEEQKIQINELYYENHNKSLTARTLGISVASVNKYLIPNYIPQSQRCEIKCEKQPSDCTKFIQEVFEGHFCDSFQKNFSFLTRLNKIDNKELEVLRKEIFI